MVQLKPAYWSCDDRPHETFEAAARVDLRSHLEDVLEKPIEDADLRRQLADKICDEILAPNSDVTIALVEIAKIVDQVMMPEPPPVRVKVDVPDIHTIPQPPPAPPETRNQPMGQWLRGIHTTQPARNRG